MTELPLTPGVSDNLTPLLNQLSLHDLQPSTPTSSSDSLLPISNGTHVPNRNEVPSRPPKLLARRSSNQDVKAKISETNGETDAHDGDILSRVIALSQEVARLLDQIYGPRISSSLRHSVCSQNYRRDPGAPAWLPKLDVYPADIFLFYPFDISFRHSDLGS